MNALSLIPGIYEEFTLFVLIFTRISALFTTCVLFRRDIINSKIIISLSVVLSIYVAMMQNNISTHIDFFSLRTGIQIVFQFLIGFIAGMVLNIMFEMFVALGQIISSQIGLGMASIMDPKMGHITSLTQFYFFSIMLLFFLFDGHLFIIKLILDSYSVIPVTAIFVPNHLFTEVLKYSSVIFNGSIMLSISIVLAILLTNFALSVMSKFAPQFNLFSIGINLSLIMGLICVYLTFDMFKEEAGNYIQDCLAFLHKLLIHPR